MISAPLDTVFRLAARVEEWPSVLAHYRAVEIVAERAGGRVVTMAAFRRGIPIPVHWKALQRIDADSSRILYRHIGGVTRGMCVEWSVIARPDGIEARIVHDFAPPWPWPGPWLARVVVCTFFVHSIADQTLAGLKAAAEGVRSHEESRS